MSHIFDLTELGQVEDYLNFDFGGGQNEQVDELPKARGRPASGRPRGRPPSIAAPKRTSIGVPDAAFDFPPDMAYNEDALPSSKKIPLRQVQEHQNLTNQLNGYAASIRFKPVIDQCGIKIKDLHTKSVAELKELRERVRACCASSGGATGILAHTTLAGCSGLEKWMPKKVCDLDGYRKTVESNPEFHKLAEMIELDSGFSASMTPIQRMAMCLGGAAMTVAAQNAQKQMLQGAQQQLVSSLIAQREAQAKAAAMAQTSPGIVQADEASKTASQPPPKAAAKPPHTFNMYD